LTACKRKKFGNKNWGGKDDLLQSRRGVRNRRRGERRGKSGYPLLARLSKKMKMACWERNGKKEREKGNPSLNFPKGASRKRGELKW